MKVAVKQASDLLGDNGNVVSSLWYHSHDTKQVAPDVFTMFDIAAKSALELH